MSARYPLVRKVSALSTRRGVLTRPSRSGSSPRALQQLPDQILHRLILYVSRERCPFARRPQTRCMRIGRIMASAQRALDIWAGELKAHPREFEVAWKLARIAYWLGTHGPEDQRRSILEQGVEAARTAATVEPGKPEGPFWLAANMGALAESFGLRAGLKYRKPIKEALETVLRLDPAFQNGSADRALGRWYFRVPGLFGGSNKQAEAHLRASLAIRSGQHHLSFFPGRAPDRRGTQERGARRAPESDRRALQARVGSRRRRLPGARAGDPVRHQVDGARRRR